MAAGWGGGTSEGDCRGCLGGYPAQRKPINGDEPLLAEPLRYTSVSSWDHQLVLGWPLKTL